jgi:hypothetical protein
MFSFEMQESGELCRRILTKYMEVEAWDSFFSAYKRAKEPIINILGPTGRVEVSAELSTNAEQKLVSYLAAIASVISAREDDVLVVTALRYLDRYFPHDWVRVGEIHAGSSIMTSNGGKAKIAKGMKLSRAVAAYLRGCGLDNDKASMITDEIFKRSQLSGTEGILVVSVNPVDLLLTGEHASFTSCHSLAGGHRSGNFQYLLDRQTLVGYFYREARKYEGVEGILPWKLWRQLIIFDVDRVAIGFCRHYPEQLISDEQHKKIREICGRAMSRLTGVMNLVWDLDSTKWEKSTFSSNVPKNATAYLDFVSLTMTASKHRHPFLILPPPMCPGCARYDGVLKPDKLVCEACHQLGQPCAGCAILTKGKEGAVKFRSRFYCTKCKVAHLFECPHCVENGNAQLLARDETVEADCNGSRRRVCVSCLSVKKYFCCALCGTYKMPPRLDLQSGDYVCEPCFKRDCFECPRCEGKCFANDRRSRGGEFMCRRCYLKPKPEDLKPKPEDLKPKPEEADARPV